MTCDDVFDKLTRGPFPSGAPGDDEVEAHLGHCKECRQLAEALRPAVELFQEAVGPDECYGLPGYHGPALWEDRPGATPRSETPAAEEELHSLPMFGVQQEWHRDGATSQRRPLDWWRFRAAFGAGRRDASGASAYDMSTRASAFRFAAAILLGITIAAGSLGLMAQKGGSTRSSGAGAPLMARAGVASSDGRGSSGQRWLAALGLPAACMPQRGAHKLYDEGSKPALDGVQLAFVDNASMRQDCCTECHHTAGVGGLSVEAQATVVRACSACH